MTETKTTPLRIAWYKFRQRRTALAAGIFLVLLALVAVLAPVIAP